MSTTITETTITPTPHRFTIAEYERMGETGILGEDARVELIRGEVIDMTPIGTPHSGVVVQLGDLLKELLGHPVLVSTQNPIHLPNNSQPQPDIVVLRRRPQGYRRAPATPADAVLVVEVADSSLHYDRTVKMPLYAEGGITEAWVVNVVQETVEIYSQPTAGTYQATRIVQRGETFTTPALAGGTLSVDDIFL